MSDTPIHDVLAELDSHGIYDHAKVCRDLREAGYTGPLPEGATNAQMVAAIDARGLGGDMAADDYPGQRYVAGHSITRAVAVGLGADTSLGDQMHGRGSAYRAYLTAIRTFESQHVGATPTEGN